MRRISIHHCNSEVYLTAAPRTLFSFKNGSGDKTSLRLSALALFFPWKGCATSCGLVLRAFCARLRVAACGGAILALDHREEGRGIPRGINRDSTRIAQNGRRRTTHYQVLRKIMSGEQQMITLIPCVIKVDQIEI